MRGIRTAAWHLLWGVMALWIYSLHANAAADGTGAPTAMPAIVQQPRPFGYVLGDTLAQRVLLESRGRNFYPASLPPVERAGLWFARRSSRVERAEDGHRWLVIDYQEPGKKSDKIKMGLLKSNPQMIPLMRSDERGWLLWLRGRACGP